MTPAIEGIGLWGRFPVVTVCRERVRLEGWVDVVRSILNLLRDCFEGPEETEVVVCVFAIGRE